MPQRNLVHSSSTPRSGVSSEPKLAPVVKLTLSYAAILITLSIAFSAVLYQFSEAQLQDTFMHMRPLPSGSGSESGPPQQIDPDQLHEELAPARRALVIDLVYFNIFVLGAGAGVSYWLAKRTIHPIEEALQAQTRFTADASHELRTPLSVMQTGIETFLRSRNITKEEALQLLDSNLEEVSKLRSLADGLLHLARANGRPLEMQTLSVGDIASDAIVRVAPSAKLKQVTVLNDVTEAKILGDHQSLTELVVTLLDNAVKYSQPNTGVTIATRKAGKFLELSVTDKGRGIAPIDLNHIFERFYRADKSRSTTDVEGHGLGLTIAKHIADAHMVEIRVNSVLGKGSTFLVELRLA
jgi:signal transduction histidine kinase